MTFIFNPLALQLNPPSVSIRSAYSLILALSTPTTIPLDIECSLILLPSGQVNNSAINCPEEPVSSVTLTSSSAQLKLEQTEIQFKVSIFCSSTMRRFNFTHREIVHYSVFFKRVRLA